MAEMAAHGGGGEPGRGEGWQSGRDQKTFLCVASPGTENLVTEQAGILQARQLPLGPEASLFPPCKTDIPTPGALCGREQAAGQPVYD